MLSPDVRVEGFTTQEWLRLAEIVRAPAFREPLHAPKGGVVAVTTSARLRKLVSTRSGRLEHVGHPWPLELSELAARHGARWAVELTMGSLERLADRFGERIRPSDTYLSQTLEFLRVMRELETDGGLRVWPWPVAEWPIPTERAVVRAMDALCPVGRVAAIGVFERGALYTALALRRAPKGIDAIVGPEELRPALGLLSGDFRRDAQFLGEAVEKVVGPLALGCYGELSTFQALAEAPLPGAWATAVFARDIVLEPASPGVAIPLGLDAGRALLSGVKGLVERFGGGGLVRSEKLVSTLERGVPLFVDDVQARLGFDPLKLLARLLARRDGA
jgi:hypothetical protein